MQSDCDPETKAKHLNGATTGKSAVTTVIMTELSAVTMTESAVTISWSTVSGETADCWSSYLSNPVLFSKPGWLVSLHRLSGGHIPHHDGKPMISQLFQVEKVHTSFRCGMLTQSAMRRKN